MDILGILKVAPKAMHYNCCTNCQLMKHALWETLGEGHGPAAYEDQGFFLVHVHMYTCTCTHDMYTCTVHVQCICTTCSLLSLSLPSSPQAGSSSPVSSISGFSTASHLEDQTEERERTDTVTAADPFASFPDPFTGASK